MRLQQPITWWTWQGQDHRPALLCPGEVDDCWSTSIGDLWWSRRQLWLHLDDRVAAISLRGRPEVHDTEHGLVIWDGISTLIRASRDHTELRLSTSGARGWHTELRRAGHSWVAALPLPIGARHAKVISPLPMDRGLVWADGGWIYRQIGSGPPEPMGLIRPDETVHAGPGGRVLVGQETPLGLAWTRVLTHAGNSVMLSEPAHAESLRWGPRGDSIAWTRVGQCGPEGLWASLATGDVSTMGDGLALGCDALWREDGSVVSRAGQVLRDDLCTTSICVSPDQAELAGPGRRIWSVASGRSRSAPFSPGLFVPPSATDPCWWHFGEDGDASTLAPGQSTPQRRAEGRRAMSDVWRAADGIFGLDDEGDAFAWRSHGWQRETNPAPPPDASYARVSRAWSSWARHGVRCGQTVLAWTRDGRLVRLPPDALV